MLDEAFRRVFSIPADERTFSAKHPGEGGKHMDAIETPTPEEERPGGGRLQRLRLRFTDPALETEFNADPVPSQHRQYPLRFRRRHRPLGRMGHPAAPLPHRAGRPEGRRGDAIRRVHPDVGRWLRASYTRIFERIWEGIAVAIATATLWSGSTTSRIETLPLEYGYVGVILITSFHVHVAAPAGSSRS